MRQFLNYLKVHKLAVIYLFYVCLAVVKGFKVEDSFEIKIKSIELFVQISPIVVALLILTATSISLYAIIRFDKDKDIIEKEAIGVAIKEIGIDKVRMRLALITCKPVRGAMLLSAGLACFVVSIASGGNWKSYTCVYASVLVGVLIWLTLYGYIYFFIIIMCMKEVYEWEFREYTYIYPLATTIFNRFNGVCTYGLICFWAIGIILIFLSLMVFDKSSLGLMLVIGSLILLGYVFFTFYPYYLTRKKVSLLKLQTIRTMFLAKNMMIKENYDSYVEVIKNVSDSPNVLSTNFNLVLTSTLTAIAGLFTSIFTLWQIGS